MKDKVEELSNSCLKAFAIGTGDEEVFAEGELLHQLATIQSANLLKFVAQK